MKKNIVLVLCIFLMMCSSCKHSDKAQAIEPQEAQMRSICELATMECYYHNVAKYKEEDAEHFLWIDHFLWRLNKQLFLLHLQMID